LIKSIHKNVDLAYDNLILLNLIRVPNDHKESSTGECLKTINRCVNLWDLLLRPVQLTEFVILSRTLPGELLGSGLLRKPVAKKADLEAHRKIVTATLGQLCQRIADVLFKSWRQCKLGNLDAVNFEFAKLLNGRVEIDSHILWRQFELVHKSQAL
jgi:hypothetical protein